MKLFLKKIKIEEFVLFFTFISLSLFFFYLHGSFSWFIYFKTYFFSISDFFAWWIYPIFYFFLFIPFLYLHLFLTKKILNLKIDLKFPREGFKIKNFLYFLRLIILTFLAFGIVTSLLGLLSAVTRERLATFKILKLEEIFFGQTPFFYFNSSSFPLKFLFDALSFLFIFSFLYLSFIFSFAFLFFYLEKNSYFLKVFLISTFLVLIFGIIFWYFFPVTSPFNTFWPELKENPNFSPNFKVKMTIEKFYQSQKDNPPISTFPSMHWAFGFILVYCFSKRNKKTLFFFIPWYLFSNIGSLLLGAHYLLDGILGIILAILAIFISNILIQIEKRYYLGNEEEEKFKESLRYFLFSPYIKEVEIFKKLFNIKNIKGP